MNTTELTQRRDELKRDKEATERTIEIQTRSLRNIESELAKIESSLARPEPKFEVGQEVDVLGAMASIVARKYENDIWWYQFREGGGWVAEGAVFPAPIPVTDEAEREALLDFQAARKVAGEFHCNMLDALKYGRHGYDAFVSRLESKRPGALERLRK